MFQFRLLLSFFFLSLSAQATSGVINCLCPKTDKRICCRSSSGKTFTTTPCECRCQTKSEVIFNVPCNECQCKPTKRPVCCRNETNGLFIAKNACECKCNGKLTFESCKPASSPIHPQKPKSCTCPEIFAPVCCKRKRDGTFFTADNKCFCECEGRVTSDKPCEAMNTPPPRPSPCVCPLFFDPICCENAAGDLVTKSNGCFCGCDGGTVAGGTLCAEE